MFTDDQIYAIKQKAIETLKKKFSEGKDKEVELLANQFLKVEEDNADILQVLGLIKYKNQDYKSSIELFEKACSINPNNYENYNNLGLCYAGLGKFDQSIEIIEKAIKINPDLDFLHSNLGLQLRNKKETLKAIECFKKALSIKQTAETWGMLGGCYGELRDLNEAEKCFLESLNINPKHAAAHVDLASIYHLKGEWERSWPEYEWRNELYEQTKFWEKIYDPKTKWNGKDDISQKRILIHSEQGTGDLIHFFRYVKFLKEKGAFVILHCWDSLKSLLESYVDEIYVKDPSEIPIFTARNSDFDIPKYDFQCSIISLPYLLQLKHIPTEPYLSCKTTFNVQDYSNYLKIGIVWAGNPQHPNDATRSCYLKDFKKIHDMPNVKLFNLQKDMRPRMYRFQENPIDLTEGTENMKIVDVSQFQTDFEKTAAIINSMDLIATVDTAILHLAGAMNKKTFALISTNCDWRWKIEGKENDWYPSVTLIRQKKLNDWSSVFEELELEIKNYNENNIQNK